MRLEAPVPHRLCRAASFATQHGDSAECLTRVWKTEQRSRNIRKNSSGLGLAEEERHTPDTSTVIPWAEVPEWIKRTKWTESQPSSWASYWAQAQCGQLPHSPATMMGAPAAFAAMMGAPSERNSFLKLSLSQQQDQRPIQSHTDLGRSIPISSAYQIGGKITCPWESFSVRLGIIK